MHNAIELDMLVRHIGDAKARELVKLAARPSLYGIAQEAFDELAKAVRGYSGMYGSSTVAREALEDLMERYKL